LSRKFLSQSTTIDQNGQLAVFCISDPHPVLKMHYIRLLSPPAFEHTRSGPKLKVVVSITTDLGDSFLSPDKPVPIRVHAKSQGNYGPIWTELTPPKSLPTWRAGLYVLKLELTVPAALSRTYTRIYQLHVRPAEERLVASKSSVMANDTQGLIVPVWVDVAGPGEEAAHVCSRILKLFDDGPSTLHVEEEIGDTNLARHIWDGGLMAVAHLANMCAATPPAGFTEGLAGLKAILSQDKELNILEIGSGIGTLGIGLAQILQGGDLGRTQGAHILMTDLPEAEERIWANVSRYNTAVNAESASKKAGEDASEEPAARVGVTIDYENLDWEDGKDGRLGPKVKSKLWDLIVISDCTYNTATLLSLANTLAHVHWENNKLPDLPLLPGPTPDDPKKPGWNGKLMLATKPRHDSEQQFLKYFNEVGYVVDDQVVLPLPMLDSDPQRVEIYLFERKWWVGGTMPSNPN
jgi:hypothetical protein